MALMLRKTCQPILDLYDLDAYHADLNPLDKSLQIYTPCGKEFALVSGVRFGTLNPTKVEMEFASELLEDWLQRNRATIETFITLSEALQRTPWLEDTEEFVMTVRKDYKNNRWITIPTGLTITHQCITYEVDVKSKYIHSMVLNIPIPVGSSPTLPLDVFTRGVAFHTQVMAHRKASQKVDDMLATLNTCKS